MFREKQCTVEVVAPDAVPTLRADPDRLTQVMLNLLSNAAKFVPIPRGRVCVRLDCDETGMTVKVSDNGPGVPEAQQRLVFDRFHQGGDATQRPHGTGLGLPISQQIVAHFGGHLWLEQTPGEGACFAFHLPWPKPQTQSE
jgi:signal transduction histidine kinase